MAQLQYPESWGDDASGAVSGPAAAGSRDGPRWLARELETEEYRLITADGELSESDADYPAP